MILAYPTAGHKHALIEVVARKLPVKVGTDRLVVAGSTRYNVTSVTAVIL